jgi:hypothetical protein
MILSVGIKNVKLRLATQSPILRFGLALMVIGVLAVVSLLIYNHGLEDALPFVLYFVAWSTIPLGLLLCLVAVCLNLMRGRPGSSH